MKRGPAIAVIGFFAALIAVHAIVGWWQPLQTDDWDQWLWTARRDDAWLASHFTFSDAAGYALAHVRWLHAAVCGVAFAALVIGAWVNARRRLPALGSWRDGLELIGASALLWITQPRPGFTWFARPNVATHVVGCAIALWLIAALRCRWRVGRAGTVAIAIAGVLVGASSRQIAGAAVIGVALWLRRTPAAERARWMWIGFAALVAGAIAGFCDAPYLEVPRVIRRGLEPNLIVLNLPIRECGQLIALALLLVLARLALAALPRQPSPAPSPEVADATPGAADRAPPPPQHTLTWLWTWLAICVGCLFGPRYSEATLLPASLVLVIAALPYLPWLCEPRALRWPLIAAALGVHAIAWGTALPLFAKLGGEFDDRMTRLETAPVGSVAVIAPYSENLPSSWFFGEDWSSAARQLAGIELFGVRDIAFAPRFGKLEDNPQIASRLEADGPTADRLRAAAPVYWATDVASAREQFERMIKRAQRAGATGFTARLAVTGVELPERNGRPLDIAWYERGALTAPRVVRSNPDPNDRQQITLPGAIAAALPDVYILEAGKVRKVAPEGGAYRVQPMAAGLTAVIACDPKRCLLVDAFLPRF